MEVVRIDRMSGVWGEGMGSLVRCPRPVHVARCLSGLVPYTFFD